MNELTTTDAAELGRLLSAGEVTAVDVTKAYLDRIAAEDGALGAVGVRVREGLAIGDFEDGL